MGNPNDPIQLTRIERNDPRYPGNLLEKLGVTFPPFIDTLGNLDLLKHHKVALFCSRRCPAEKISEAQDLAHQLRDEGATVISGFHSPVEKECLRVLLKGTQPVIICSARGLAGMRIPRDWQDVLRTGRLLLVSPFEKVLRRLTASSSLRRNEIVVALAEKVHFIYAEPGGQIAELQMRVNATIQD